MAVSCYAICLPGLESFVATELTSLGVRPKPERGGVSFKATTRQLYASNLWLRCATRVLVRVAEFRVTSFFELEARLGEVDLEPFLQRGAQYRVSSHQSKLWHTDAIAARCGRVLGIDEQDDAPLVFVRAMRDRFTISVDTSGEALHLRGWRRELAKAPLRPTIAAALLHAAGWSGESPVLDPFCGSGTIPIEAALLAAGKPAHAPDRSFAFQRWPSFEPGTWASARAPRLREGATVSGADRDAGAIAAATANAARAGAAAEFREAAFSDSLAHLEQGAFVVTNAPFDRRVQGGHKLARAFGDALRKSGAAKAVVLCSDAAFVKAAGLDPAPLFETVSGGVAVSAHSARG